MPFTVYETAATPLTVETRLLAKVPLTALNSTSIAGRDFDKSFIVSKLEYLLKLTDIVFTSPISASVTVVESALMITQLFNVTVEGTKFLGELVPHQL